MLYLGKSNLSSQTALTETNFAENHTMIYKACKAAFTNEPLNVFENATFFRR